MPAHQMLKEAVHACDGVTSSRRQKRLKRLYEQHGITDSTLFKVPKSKQQDRVELGDIGELIGVLALAAHIGLPLGEMVARNLLKANARYSKAVT